MKAMAVKSNIEHLDVYGDNLHFQGGKTNFKVREKNIKMATFLL